MEAYEPDPLKNEFGSRCLLARVDSLDYLTDEGGSQVLDVNQNPIPTGLLSITFLERGGGRTKVPFVVPAGNTAWAGGLPELNSLCVVSFRQSNEPIILGFLPPSIHALVNSRQTVPNLVSGEQFFQASIPDFDVNADANFFAGANVWLDRYGRLVIRGLDYEFVMGYLLSNEFTSAVTRLVDPVTGQAIYFREKIKGVERRVDDQGNAVFSYPKARNTQVGGDSTETVNGQATFTSKRGFTMQDGKGNSFALNDDGSMVITLNAGSFTVTSMGNVTFENGASRSEVTADDEKSTVGGDQALNVGGKRSTQIGGAVGGVSDLKVITTGDDEEHIITGSKRIIAAQQAILSGLEVLLGELASHPIPLGDILLTIINDIIAMVSALAAVVPGGVGPPAIASFLATLAALTPTLNSLVSLTE